GGLPHDPSDHDGPTHALQAGRGDARARLLFVSRLDSAAGNSESDGEPWQSGSVVGSGSGGEPNPGGDHHGGRASRLFSKSNPGVGDARFASLRRRAYTTGTLFLIIPQWGRGWTV